MKKIYQLYPEVKPNHEIMLSVSELHTIYVASYGNKEGIPAVALHGGPGSGTSPFFSQFFNPTQYFVILIDQRGAGKSLPKGEMRENTTQLLIEDMEKVREYFKIKKWLVLGGSWGSTLALLYAQAHPTNVLALVLRGIFLGRFQDINAFVNDNSPAAKIHSREWKQFKFHTTKLLLEAKLNNVSVETHPIYHLYFLLLQNSNVNIRDQAASTIASWEKYNSYLIPNPNDLMPQNHLENINMGLTEANYFENECFIKPNQILENLYLLKDIPIYIIQGIYDLVCPAYQADELEEGLRKINDSNNCNLIKRFDVMAGHSHKDEEIQSAIIKALDDFATMNFKF